MENITDTASSAAFDQCALCGWRGIFEEAAVAKREAQRCGNCKASLRYRNLAASILTHLGRGRYAHLRDLVRDPSIIKSASVYELSYHGPLIKYFNQIDNYTRSYYWEDVPLGHYHENVRCEDLTQLTFSDSTFDLVVSSDVMEHVINYDAAFREIFRVLRPGGSHVFSVPITWPMPANTINRVEIIDGRVVNKREERFHNSGIGSPSLVCTDFGFDLVTILENIGYEAWFERPSLMRYPGYFDVTVVSRKPRGSFI